MGKKTNHPPHPSRLATPPLRLLPPLHHPPLIRRLPTQPSTRPYLPSCTDTEDSSFPTRTLTDDAEAVTAVLRRLGRGGGAVGWLS